MKSDREFIIELRHDFIFEARERLQILRDQALNHFVESAFRDLMLRSLHSLKGESRTSGLDSFSAFVHSIETALIGYSSSDVSITDTEYLSLLDGVGNQLDYLELHIEDDVPQILQEEQNQSDGVLGDENSTNLGWGLFADDESAEPENSTETKKILLGKNDQKVFGISIEHVLEIIPDRALNKLPYPVKGVDGVIPFRGEVLPVLDMSKTKREAIPSNRTIIVCQTELNRLIGIKFDQVCEVIDFDKSKQIMNAQKNNDNKIEYVGKLGDISIQFIDMKHII